MNAPHTTGHGLQALQQLWLQRNARERGLLTLAAWVLGLALLWSVALAPALQTWQQAPQKQAALDAQTQRMLQLQAQAQRLQAPATVSRSAALKQLEASAQEWLGPKARVSLQGEQALVTLQAASPEGLARWLALARNKAQAMPLQAQLKRKPPTSPGEAVSWSGTLLLSLP